MSQKDHELVGRIQAWTERGEPQGPYSLQISPTMACDLNCVFCRRNDQMEAYYRSNKEIEHCRYVAMVRDALEMGVKVVIVKGGGEPLLRRRLILELAALIKAKGAFGNLVTNGTHLDARLARGLVAAGWDQITISLDGPDPETHDFLRAKAGTFSRIMANLDRLNAEKARAGKTLPLLGFHLVLTKRNCERIDRYIELAAKMKVGHVELDSLSLRFPENAALAMDDESTRKFAARVPEHIRNLQTLGMTHNLDSFLSADYVRREKGGSELYAQAPEPAAVGAGEIPASPRPDNKHDQVTQGFKPVNGAAATTAPRAADLPCYYPFYQAAIVPGGSIVPCCYAEETHRSKTNLNEASFREAWLTGDAEEYRQSMRSGKMMPFCKDCTAMYADNNARIRSWLAKDAHAG